ncbi:hypothetical protein BH18VER1_BH18VER1_20380 [soil metagenome]
MTHLTGWGGEVIEKYSYDAFGVPTTTYSAGSFNNRFKFTGRDYVSALGIYEYRNRAYHPRGRFMSVDPVGLQIAGTKPSKFDRSMFPSLPETFADSEFNLYRYCHNDPVNKTDPMGLYIEFTRGTEQFWKSWTKQFESRWKDSGFRDWWSRAAGSTDGYVVGPTGTKGSEGIKAESTLPRTMPRASDGSSAVARAQAVKDARQDRGTNVNHYGYPDDPTPDRNSRLGLGSRKTS